MVDSFFCAQASQAAGENLIGSAIAASTYLLVECPLPWSANALDSKAVPANLRQLIQELKQAGQPVRPLLISGDRLQDFWTVMIFRQQPGLSSGYRKQEFQVPSLEAVAPLVRECLSTHPLKDEPIKTQPSDILVCTHGSHDKCCAKYGQLFYRQAIATVADLALDATVRIWQASHIGGHRFAPTAIDFPSGRYYGRLNQESLTAILTRTGHIHCLNQVYRGWGVLPKAAQVLERELILQHGWDWFSYRVSSRLVEHPDSKSWNRVEITFAKSDISLETYQADVIVDDRKTLHLQGSCSSTETHPMPQYCVKDLVRIPA